MRKLISTQVLLVVMALLSAFVMMPRQPVVAQRGTSCSEPFAIDVALLTGARWTMCWEDRAHEGIVLREITFTPPGQPQRLILYRANLAQLHVPYDDNGARLHDLSDFGLGGLALKNMSPEECPLGTLLQSNNRNVLCMQIASRGHAFNYYTSQLPGYVLTLFSISQVGQYNYMVRWDFYDNGTIQPAVGATGKLQRYSNDPSYGWPLDATHVQYGVSHTHNYYWRLDFDLGGLQDDVAEEITFMPSADQSQFNIVQTEIMTESARQVSDTGFRFWRVKDSVITNDDGHAISYELEPDSSNVFRGPTYEPWTQAEFYVTRVHSCEQWASHNPTTAGCASNLSAFVNGESMTGDLVLWYGHSFHHVARDEDQDYIDTHWSYFSLRPRDLSADNPLAHVGPLPEPSAYLPTILK